MSFFMGKRFVGFGGKGLQEGPQKGPEMVFDSGEDGSREMKRVLRPIKFGILVVSVIITALDSFYALSENEMAVLTTFGKPSSVIASGPRFKYPFIQKVCKMSKEVKGMPIRYDSDYNTEYLADSENDPVSLPSESEMITKDFNFVNMDFRVEYQIADLIEVYISSDMAISILKDLAQSYIRDTVGSYSVDKVITADRSEIQTKVKSLLLKHLEQEGIGIGIVNVIIQDVEPPTKVISNAFKAVGDIKQGMDIEINEARKYQSKQLSAANAEADRTARDMEAYRQQRTSGTEGQVFRFNGMYEEYTKRPLITKKGVFYETMGELLPTLRVIVNGSNGTQTMPPLDSFVSENQNGGAW